MTTVWGRLIYTWHELSMSHRLQYRPDRFR